LVEVVDLRSEDITRIIDAPSSAARAKAAEKLAGYYRTGLLDAGERIAAEEVFRLLRYDSEIIVRRVLGEWLKDAPDLPRDIAVSLATDRPEIATGVLEHSPVLDDEDLMEILRAHPGEHRAAVARRSQLAPAVVDELCRCGNEKTVLALLANGGANFAEPTLHFLLDARRHWPAVREAIARRRLLPIRIAESLRAPYPACDNSTSARSRAAS
jgi:uncharacterized protein (DUF2336 family)